MSRAAARVAAVIGAVLLVGGCIGKPASTKPTSTTPTKTTPTKTTPLSTTPTKPAPTTTTPTKSAPAVSRKPTSRTTPIAALTCPGAYPAPDPNRPRVTLAFTVAPGLRTVTGAEQVRFVPDRPTGELIFRLTPNTAHIVAEGSRIQVTAATANRQGGPFTVLPAGTDPSTQGGLLRIPLQRVEPAGTVITADLRFTMTIGGAYYDRMGSSGGFAWFASAQPLLAWERGYGWHTEDMVRFPAAESTTSEAMDTDLTVTAPAADTVIMTGDPTAPTRSGAELVWHAHIPTARDVSVAVGPFVVSDTVVDGVHLRVGADTIARRDTLVPIFQRALHELAIRFGPYPFPSLSVARLPPNLGGGIEYPAAIQMQSELVSDAVHETAHQWFYALVGDSQPSHPWMDEAFAEYAERLVDDRPEPSADLDAPGTVDSSIASYGTDSYDYFRVTYAKGAAALEAARQVAGPAAWDAAMRCYVAANAWRIANPFDFEHAMAAFPAAVALLRRAGAVP